MRVVVGLDEGLEPGPVAQALRERGARTVQGPMPSLPDVLVADFATDDLAGTIERLTELPGVRYAEADELRSTTD